MRLLILTILVLFFVFVSFSKLSPALVDYIFIACYYNKLDYKYVLLTKIDDKRWIVYESDRFSRL